MTESLHKFIAGCDVPKDQVSFIVKHIIDIKEKAYMKGYMDSVKAKRRRDGYRNIRIKKKLHRFLDYLSDITHGDSK